MFVHPDFARQGVGSELLHVSEAAAKSCGFHQAELISTLTGVPFYTAKGYTPLKAIEVFLPEGVSMVGLQMSKALN
jgi:GNAT superfamily N-acetyltransferase